MASDALRLRGLLKGHTGSVTCLTTASDNPDFLLSGSRDCTLLLWNVTKESQENYGAPKRRLFGHGHFVQDVVISVDGQFALSGSWDSTLRLWELQNGTNTRTFVGHNKDVLSVAFSSDNRQIVSASRDKTIKLWNTLGDCKFTMEENGHNDWVSCVRFSPNPQNPIIVSGGWDKKVKVWNLTTCKLVTDLTGHTGYVNTVTISPDGSLCASGGRDGMVRLWDLNEGKHLYALEAKDTVNALCFSPTRYWLCAGTNSGLKIWDLESKDLVADITSASEGFGASEKHPDPTCNCLSWSSDGSILYAGYSDHVVRVWEAPK